ncbi:SMP-30/gluconolactonase/LRE family protein [Ilyomonas limi]|uniref:SMP-30/gluconolactonase/LRE family protein n=1 Tax=Ilyomonas limi TaxID=2575867 RepID=A0A4V5UUA9_9BACT|nr:SMP-30/gluconolactonase/LRE family protein [Ilyomonas limi]TKK68333.1 SMP-30/gluconolactonase/LRE family protein [Ilyomonas limi]
MKLLFCISTVLLFAGCNNQPNSQSMQQAQQDSAIGKIEWYDSSAASIIDSNAAIEVIGKGYNWSEGPVWIAEKRMLLFSDVPENKIYQWKEGDTPRVYLMPAGYTGSTPREGEIGSNGLALDATGNLLLCQSGNRQVARMSASLDAPKPDFTALAANYNGKKFNSPNDLVADSKNNIYFTDPVYGLPKGADDPARELPFEGVYKISAGGKLSLLIDSIPRPNGIAFSPDEHTLYLASSDEQKPAWYAFQLDENGNIKSGGVLLNALPLKQKAAQKQGPDGMKIDQYGNIFGAGPDGINIISPAGKLLGLIKVYNRFTSNCSFSATKDTLYVTADDMVLRVKLR